MKFLRSEKYNAKKAARRMMLWLDCIHSMYMTDKVLMRPIRLSDLNQDAIEIAKEGSMLLIGSNARDSSGRHIVAVFSDIGRDFTPTDRVS
jgi:hypothetical protein